MAETLRELQRTLATSITNGRDEVPRAWIALPADADPGERVAVHIDGYPARIAESIRQSFPATSQLLGDGRLAELLERYLASQDDIPRNLNDIGYALPTHITSDPLAEDLPFLSDLAAFEWAIHTCFNAEAVAPFDPSRSSDWSMADWDDAQIEYQPTMQLVRSIWPLRELRDARDTPRDEIDIDLSTAPRSFLVRRDGFEVVSDPIDENEADAIMRFRAGDTLGEVMTLLEERGTEAEEVVAYFARWSSLGLVASCGPRHMRLREH